VGTEIEHKFLARTELLPPLAGGQRIIQGYLCLKPQVRFRLVEEAAATTAGPLLVITVKNLREDGSRFEVETEKKDVAPSEAEEIKRLAICPPIEKIRYRIPYGGLAWEVDLYQGRNAGLVTVDVETPYVGFPLDFPPWVDHHADITADPRYFNWNLGRCPFGLWQGADA